MSPPELPRLRRHRARGGVTEIRIPGERAYQTRARLMQEGIEIDRKIYDALGRVAERNLDHGA